MFGLFADSGNEKRPSRHDTTESIRYSDDIDAIDIVAELRNRDIRGVCLKIDEKTLSFPSEFRADIEELLQACEPDERAVH